MIKTEKGRTTISGSYIETLADLASCIAAVKQMFEELGFPDEEIRADIAECGRRAFLTPEEREAETAELLGKLSEEDLERMMEIIASME